MTYLHNLAIIQLGGSCPECGAKEKLRIHHIDGNHKNNTYENLKLLCSKCHYWTQKGHFKKDMKKPKEAQELRVTVGYTMDPQLIAEIRKRSEKSRLPMSRYVEITLRKALRL